MGWVHNPCKCKVKRIPSLPYVLEGEQDGAGDRRSEGEMNSRESMRMLDGGDNS